MLPLLLFASHYVYLLFFSFMLLLFIPFKKITFIYLVFFSIFFICSSLLAKLFWFYLLCCFAPFSHLFFSIVFFRTREIDPFFRGRKKLFNPSKNFFLKFCHFMFKKSLIVFRIFEIPLKQFFVISYKKHTNGICNQQCLSRSSFSDNLFVLSKISVSPAF